MSDSAKIRLGDPVYRDAQHVIAVCENTILTYSSDGPNPRYLEAWGRAVEQVLARFHGDLLAITIIDRHAHAPDDNSKARIRDTVLRHAAGINGFAYVVEGEGFGAAAVRSALSLISLTARYPFPQKVFARLEEAVPWALSRPRRHGEGHMPDAAELVRIGHSLRGQVRDIAETG